MTVYRTRKQLKAYRRHRKYIEPAEKGCAFCSVHAKSPQLVKLTTNFKIIDNIFPYSFWDSLPVKDHLLLVPVKHTDTLADLTAAAAQEFVKLICEYESRGYNIYARAPGSAIKTIHHQHTHLIRLAGSEVRGLFYLKKPHMRFLIR